MSEKPKAYRSSYFCPKPALHLRLTLSRSLLAFQAFRAGALLLGSVLVAQFAENQHEVGFLEELLLLGGAITFFWVSGLINPLLPYFQGLSKNQKQRLPPKIFVLLSIFSLVAHAGAWFLLRGKGNPFLTPFLLYSSLSAPAFLYEYLLFLEGKQNWLLGYGLVNALGYLLCLSLPSFTSLSMAEAIHFLPLYGGARYLLTCSHLSLHYQWRLSIDSTTKFFLQKATPYAAALLLSGAFSYVDGLVVNAFFDKASFALYRYGARELPIALLMASAFSNAKSAELANYIKAGRLEAGLKNIRAGASRLMHMLFPVTILLIFIAKPLFVAVYGLPFAPASVIFQIFLLLTLSRICFPQTILLALHKNHLLLWITGIELLLNIGLDLGLVRSFGLEGIAWATIGAYFGEKFLLIWAAKREGIDLNSYFSLRLWSVYAMLTVLSFMFSRYL